jgi:hypothetical protein
MIHVKNGEKKILRDAMLGIAALPVFADEWSSLSKDDIKKQASLHILVLRISSFSGLTHHWHAPCHPDIVPCINILYLWKYCIQWHIFPCVRRGPKNTNDTTEEQSPVLIIIPLSRQLGNFARALFFAKRWNNVFELNPIAFLSIYLIVSSILPYLSDK